ncbi:MAG: hypothetical protein LUB62_02565 [Prevotellaceae bacterium]|nr:hypothetical protein [Prevotellaceae bacterium]
MKKAYIRPTLGAEPVEANGMMAVSQLVETETGGVEDNWTKGSTFGSSNLWDTSW